MLIDHVLLAKKSISTVLTFSYPVSRIRYLDTIRYFSRLNFHKQTFHQMKRNPQIHLPISATMKADTTLITGATGHLGFKVLVLALEAGYNARVAVRSQSGIENILKTPSIKRLNSGSNIEFIIVPDILVPGAYDEAVKNVDFIIHCASPITSGIWHNFILTGLSDSSNKFSFPGNHEPRFFHTGATSIA
jgi:hypothetical protein